MYGYPDDEAKSKIGELMVNLKKASQLPRLCEGDFNLMLTSSDKKGGGNFKTHEANILREAVRECNFSDLGYVRHDYMWSNNRGGDQNLQEGLDRFFANEEWKERFPGAYVTYLDKRKSGHLPVLLSCKGIPNCTNDRRKWKLYRGGVWQVDVLKELFSEEEVKEIMKIPLPKFDTRDVWACNQTKDGEYSVKSAYHVALKQKREAQPSTSSMEQERVWKELWAIEAPPKIKNFGWQALQRGIPARAKILSRGIRVDDICPQCGEERESSLHLLTTCENAKGVWRISRLRLNVCVEGRFSFKDWVSKLSTCYKEKEWWSLFWCILWEIWNRRNGWDFEQKRREHIDVNHKAVSLIGEYSKAQGKPTNGNNAVVRDYDGDVVVAACKKKEGEYAVDVAEAMAMRFSLQIAIEAGFHKFILEVDNLKLFNHRWVMVKPLSSKLL
ncbi:hypothetical protein RDABS01_038005 [Bienertia sinuspersici]